MREPLYATLLAVVQVVCSKSDRESVVCCVYDITVVVPCLTDGRSQVENERWKLTTEVHLMTLPVGCNGPMKRSSREVRTGFIIRRMAKRKRVAAMVTVGDSRMAVLIPGVVRILRIAK